MADVYTATMAGICQYASRKQGALHCDPAPGAACPPARLPAHVEETRRQLGIRSLRLIDQVPSPCPRLPRPSVSRRPSLSASSGRAWTTAPWPDCRFATDTCLFGSPGPVPHNGHDATSLTRPTNPDQSRSRNDPGSPGRRTTNCSVFSGFPSFRCSSLTSPREITQTKI